MYDLSLEEKLVWWYVVASDHVGLYLHIPSACLYLSMFQWPVSKEC